MLRHACYILCLLSGFSILSVKGDCNLPNPSYVGNTIPSNYDEPFSVGFELEYECRTGFIKDGVVNGTKRTCLSDGSWTDVGFDCIAQDCGIPDTPTHGSALYNRTTFGATVDFSCDEGYTLDGDVRATCAVAGENVAWNKVSPTCNVVVCPAPVAPANGTVDDAGVSDYTYLTSITYKCNSGYKLPDGTSSTAECNAEGTWGDVPTCEVDYDCTFEKSADGSCGYTSTGAWERTFYNPSATGSIGYAYFIEGAGGGSLRSLPFTAGAQGACLSFYYEISSPNAAEFFVSVQREDGSDTETTIFTAGSATTSDFVPEEIDLSNYTTASVVWTFHVTAAAANIALDEIALRTSSCGAPTTQSPTTQSPTTQSLTTQAPSAQVPTTQFTSESGAVVHSTKENAVTAHPIDVETTSASQLTASETGHSCDFEDSFRRDCGYSANVGWQFIYTNNASNGVPGYVAKISSSVGGMLISQPFTADLEGACLRFYYRIVSQSVATLSLTLQPADGSGEEVIKFSSGNSPIEWTKERVDLSGTYNSVWKFFVPAAQAQIEVDDVELYKNPCTKATTPTSTTQEDAALRTTGLTQSTHQIQGTVSTTKSATTTSTYNVSAAVTTVPVSSSSSSSLQENSSFVIHGRANDVASEGYTLGTTSSSSSLAYSTTLLASAVFAILLKILA